MAKQLEEANWQREVAEQRLARVKIERDELEENFMAAILEIQQKANLKQLVLEKKLETLQETLQCKEVALKQAISSGSCSQSRDAGTHSSGETVVYYCSKYCVLYTSFTILIKFVRHLR